MKSIALPQLSENMVSNKYLTLAVTPAGAAYLFVNDNKLNSLERVHTAALDWTKPLPPAIAAQNFDLVIAADCVFWEWLFEPLIDTLLRLLSPSTRVILSMTHRFGRTEKFLTMLAARCPFQRLDNTAVRVSNTDIYELLVFRREGAGDGSQGGGVAEAMYARAGRRTEWGAVS